MRKLRLAVIGAGHLGRIHARLATELAEAELVGVVDPSEQARNQIGQQLGVATFASADQLAGQIDAAILATPTSLHASMGLELLSAGIHLLIEKPLALDAEQGRQLVEAARKNLLVLQVGHVERFNPALETVRAEIEQPRYIQATRTSSYPFRSTDIGAVLDIMIHDIDVVLSLVRSEVEQVQAFGLSVLGSHEDTANARVTFANGCIADFTASRVSYQPQRTMQIWSADAFASVDFNARQTTIVRPDQRILAREFDLETLTTDEKSYLKENLFEELLQKQEIPSAECNPLFEEQQDFVRSILQARVPRVSGEDGLRALALADDILTSIEQHQWDGTATGRIGPFAQPIQTILRSPHFDHPGDSFDAPVERREAG